MLDYYDWKELRSITKLLRQKLKLPGDIGFKWPPPLTLPPPPRPMEIRLVEPGPEPRRKDIPLSYEEVDMLVDALNGYHEKYMHKIARTNQPRTKKESIELGKRQELFQRFAMFRFTFDDLAVPYTEPNDSPK